MLGNLMKTKHDPSCFLTKMLWNALKTSSWNCIQDQCRIYNLNMHILITSTKSSKCIHPSFGHTCSRCEPTQEVTRCNGGQESTPHLIVFAIWILQLHFQFDIFTPSLWGFCIQPQLLDSVNNNKTQIKCLNGSICSINVIASTLKTNNQSPLSIF